jgi:SEC-C motif-containing protein
VKTGRNDPCPCGSGKKYKHCCYAKDSVKHEMPEPEETATDEAATDEADGEQGQEPGKAQPTHHKDRSRFEGKAKGRGNAFRPNATRSSQRGS